MRLGPNKHNHIKTKQTQPHQNQTNTTTSKPKGHKPLQKEEKVENVKGYPRPVAPGKNGKNWPMPWTGENGPNRGIWAYIDPIRMNMAIADDLCIMCGLPLSDDWVNCLIFGEPGECKPYTPFDVLFGEGIKPSTKCHPRCAIMACTFCPHLRSQTYPIMTQDGKKWSVADFKASQHHETENNQTRISPKSRPNLQVQANQLKS